MDGWIDGWSRQIHNNTHTQSEREIIKKIIVNPHLNE
jgi:hypothetical protein